jgi:DNA-binding ferritin-like protein (Dps family)
MPDRTEQFLSLFRDEINDSIYGVRYLAVSMERKYKRDEITAYVYNENESFLAQEIAGLKQILSFLDQIPIEGKTPDNIAGLVKSMIQQRAKEYEDPEAVYRIVDKKLAKSLKYLGLITGNQ